MSGITVAIDGPAASGKSTTAARVAEALGYQHLNSGLLYRAITWAVVTGALPDDGDFAERLSEIDIRLERSGSGFRVVVDGVDPGADLISPSISARVSEVAARPPVRARVLDLLRGAGRDGRVVCDGRDIGTVVFPAAELKIFLVASPEERGKRRLLDLGLEPTSGAIEAEARRLAARDEADSSRALAPLREAEDAVRLDTTRMSPREVVLRILELAGARGAVVG